MKTRTQKSLVAAINRKLTHEGQRLRATRAERFRNELGGHYIVNLADNRLVAAHVDLHELAREMGIDGGAA